MKMPVSFIAVLILSACASSDYHGRNIPAAVDVEAGAIHDDDEARQICPSVCGARGWAGAWRRIGDGSRAVCGCSTVSSTPADVVAMPPSQPTACSVQGNEACAGCAISCPSGQQAACTEGVTQRTSAGSALCEVPARCMCH